jgi:hypothetical protein
MRIAHANLVAALTGLAIVGLTPHAYAQAQEAQRDAAIHRCILQVQAQYPGSATDGDTQRNRVSAYKACMTQAGFQP